jgi:hypothetical protein
MIGYFTITTGRAPRFSPESYALHSAHIRHGVPMLTAGQVKRFGAIAATTDLCPGCGMLKRVDLDLCPACESYVTELIEDVFGPATGADDTEQ